MKILSLLSLFVVLVPFAARADTAAADSQPVEHFVMNNTELRPLHSDVTGRDYLLYIAYPDSYASHPDRKYPVVYLTDAYWSFSKVASIGSSLWYDQIVPEYILVGIGYVGDNVDYGRERMYELTPTVLHNEAGEVVTDYGRTGGARAFLDSIKTEIIPYVESNFRVDPSFRALMGSSLGGLFSLFAMYEEPDLFQGIVAGSPAVGWANRWIFRRESQLKLAQCGNNFATNLHTKFHMPARLFMCVGSEEWNNYQNEVKAFAQLAGVDYSDDFAFEFRIIDGERHSGNTSEAYNRGIRFVFEPQMPSPTIPDND